MFHKNLREDLIHRVKYAGQELIDKAEGLVPDIPSCLIDFDIYISFPRDAVTEITATSSMECAREIKALFDVRDDV